jgi:hypothetical protein
MNEDNETIDQIGGIYCFCGLSNFFRFSRSVALQAYGGLCSVAAKIR